MSLNKTLAKKLGAAALSSLIAISAVPALASGGSGGGGGGGFGGGGSGANAPRQQIDPAVAYRAGLDAYQAKKYKKAAREFRKVLSVDRRSPEANYFAGMSYIGLDNPKRAQKYFKTAVKSRPGFIEAREQYALTLIRLEKMEDAQEQLAALEEMATTSNKAKASVERVRTAIETGQVPDQINIALAPAGDTDLGDLIYADAVRLINTGKYESAIAQLYKTQLEVGPHADIQNYLGYTHRKLGRYAEAKAYYGRALSLNPNHLGAQEYLGELYIEIGDMKNARKQLAKLDKLCGFGCEEREELARLVNAERSQFAARIK